MTADKTLELVRNVLDRWKQAGIATPAEMIAELDDALQQQSNPTSDKRRRIERADWKHARSTTGRYRAELYTRKRDGGELIGIVEHVGSAEYSWSAGARDMFGETGSARTIYAAQLAVRKSLYKQLQTPPRSLTLDDTTGGKQ